MNEKGSRWHQATPLSVCQNLHTNAACGLSRKAARSRFKKQGRNSLFDDTTPKKKNSVKSLLLDPAWLLMLFSALLAVVFLSPLQVIFVILFLILLGVATVYFLCKNEEVSRIVSQYRTPSVRVLRDGRIFNVSATRVVVGDIILLRTGDIVPGDCRLLSAQQLRVLTLLPSEKGTPIYQEYTKNANATYTYGTHIDAPLAENMLYGGSEILCGEARAVVVAIGENSYLGAMHSFTIPTEVKEKQGENPTQRLIAPYLRVWGILMLVLLTVLTLIGLITTPTEGGLAEYFFILCILAGASSPVLISLYLQYISVRGRLLCMENHPPKNRAVIKTEAGLVKLAGITDLFVIGKRGLSDGVPHFWSAFVGERELRAESEEEKTDLAPLCEAMLLRNEADMRMPTYECAQSVESDAAVLAELVFGCRFDVAALKVRLKSIEHGTYSVNSSWQRVTANLQEGTVRFLFDNSGTLMHKCHLYVSGKRMRAVTPEYRAALRKYVEYVEENGCRALCIARESGEGTLALIGILALREQVSAVLPSVVEELSQSGIATRFFLSNDDYAHACHLPKPYLYRNAEHPKLTLELLQRYRTFIGFSREELSVLLPTYQKNGHRIAVLGGSAGDRLFLRSGILTLACDTVTNLKCYAENHIEEVTTNDKREEVRNTTQAIRRHADVIIERADRFSGGVYAALQTISHSREVGARTRILLQFWLHSQLARIVIMTLVVCTGRGLFTSLQMFLSSFVVEIAALCFLADVPISQEALRRPNAPDKKFLSQILFSKRSLITTLVSAGIPSLTVVILTLAGVISNDAARTYLFVSLLLLQICMLVYTFKRSKVKLELKKTLLIGGVVFGTIAVLLLLSAFITSLGAVTGMGAWTPLTAILLLLSPMLYWGMTLLFHFLSRTAK